MSYSSVTAQMRKIYLDSDSTNHIYKMSFFSQSEGFVAFDSYIGYTIDSGRTFTHRSISAANVNFNGYNISPTFNFHIKGLKAFNRYNLFAYGEWDLIPAILYSIDGGLSFKLVFYSIYEFSNPNYRMAILDMIFPINTIVGYAIDYDRILKTTDGGLSWNVIKLDPNKFFGKLEASGNSVYAIQYPSDTTKVLKSSDGLNWQSWIPNLNTGISGQRITNISFLNSFTGWLTTRDNLNIERLFNTSDGGNNWTKKNETDKPYFFGGVMKFFNAYNGYMLSGQNTVYGTTDGGTFWNKLERDNNYSYYNYSHWDLQVITAYQAWAGGGHGFLELTTNAGGSTTPVVSFKIDTSYSYITGAVQLVNMSNPAYTYKWYKNGQSLSTAYNSSYNANYSHPNDTIMLIGYGTKNADTLIRTISLINPFPYPIVKNFSPASGGTNTSVTITGVNFKGATTVSFGGTASNSFIVNSDTMITATVAGGSSGAITVTTLNGNGSKAGFTFIGEPAPIISSFNPASGYAGSLVTIKGNNFNSNPLNNIVFFGAAIAKVVTASNTELIVQAPTATTFERISVLNNSTHLIGYSSQPFILTFPGGGSALISDSSFMWQPANMPMAAQGQVITADFNNDGKPDLATNEGTFSRVNIFKNNSVPGAISYSSAGQYLLDTKGKFLIQMTPADIDGDGKIDIIMTRDTNQVNWDIYRDAITILKNTSTVDKISFERIPDIIDMVNQANFDVGDLDGDGKPDLVILNENVPDGNGTLMSTFSVMRNTSTPGNISFAERISRRTVRLVKRVVLSDIDQDGKQDILITTRAPQASILDSTLIIYRNLSTVGNLSFSSLINVRTDFEVPLQLRVADFDLDKKPDILVSQSGYTFNVWKNNSIPGTISLGGKQFFQSHYATSTQGNDLITDINGDGKPDFVAIGSGCFTNTSTPGNISFSSPEDGNLAKYDECIADFDGDGKVDLAVVSPGINFLRNRLANSMLCPGSSYTSFRSNIVGTSYQWQESSDGQAFKNIVNDSNFSGVSSQSVFINNIISSWNGRQYRCVVDGNISDIFTIHVQNKWSYGEGNWGDISGWSCGKVPDSNTDIVILGGIVHVNSNITVKSLQVLPGAAVIVEAGYKITVLH